MNTNKKYKDTVFVDYFNDKSRLIEMYGAIKGREYPEDTDVEIVTLEDVLYMDMINDIAFILDGRLIVLVEHQSTINENMPLRMLMYVSREYERVLANENVYREKRIKIPRPEFIVLYNGEKEYPDADELKLSESFEAPDTGVFLELTVKVYNVNAGRNREIMEKSRALRDYAEFIAEVRNGERQGIGLDEAVKTAVKSCIQNGVMSDYLADKGSEVINMLLTEFNLDKAKEVWREEMMQEGRKEGRLETAKEALRMNLPIQQIIRLTHLDEETIRAL